MVYLVTQSVNSLLYLRAEQASVISLTMWFHKLLYIYKMWQLLLQVLLPAEPWIFFIIFLLVWEFLPSCRQCVTLMLCWGFKSWSFFSLRVLEPLWQYIHTVSVTSCFHSLCMSDWWLVHLLSLSLKAYLQKELLMLFDKYRPACVWKWLNVIFPTLFLPCLSSNTVFVSRLWGRRLELT